MYFREAANAKKVLELLRAKESARTSVDVKEVC